MKAHRTIPIAQKQPIPISCNDHDYIEIACMYRYDLKLELGSGEIIDARAITTVTRKNDLGFPVEYLIVESDIATIDIPLNEIVKIETKNISAKFQSIKLKNSELMAKSLAM